MVDLSIAMLVYQRVSSFHQAKFKKNVTKMLRQESWHSMIFHDIQPPTSIVCITSTGVKHQPPFPVMFPPRWEISKTPTSAESFHILPHMYMCMYIYIYRNKPLSTVCKGPAGNMRKPPSLHDHVILRQNGPNANLPSRGSRLVEGCH